MEKAYDKDALVEILKGKGLDVAEDVAVVLVESLIDWISESAKLSEGTVDDLLAGMLPAMKPYIMEQIDKIDGEVG